MTQITMPEGSQKVTTWVDTVGTQMTAAYHVNDAKSTLLLYVVTQPSKKNIVFMGHHGQVTL